MIYSYNVPKTIYTSLVCEDWSENMSELVNEHNSGKPPQVEKLFQDDPYLRQYEADILMRWKRMVKLESDLESHEGSLAKFAEGYKNYGVVQKENGDVVVRMLSCVVVASRFVLCDALFCLEKCLIKKIFWKSLKRLVELSPSSYCQKPKQNEVGLYHHCSIHCI